MEKINVNINDIKSFASDLKTFTKGLDYYNSSHVTSIDIKASYDSTLEEQVNTYTTKVKGNYCSFYDVSIKIDNDGNMLDYECNCPAFLENSGSCKHIVAAMLKIHNIYNSQKVKFVSNLDSLMQNRSQATMRNLPLEDLIKTFESKITESVKNEQRNGTINLEPILFIPEKNAMSIEFKIGDTRKYVVKDAYALGDCIKNSTVVKYGKSLEFNHEISGFEKSSQPLAIFLRDEAETYRQIIAKTQSVFNSYNVGDRYLKILPFSLDDFFDLFENKTLECHGYNYKYEKLTFINKDPDTEFYIEMDENNYSFTTNLKAFFISQSRNNTYIIAEDKFYRCSREFVNNVLPAINKIMMQKTNEIMLSDEYMGKFCSSVLPQISKNARVKSNVEMLDKFKIQPLKSSIYLDAGSQGFLYANLIFSYGNIEINPLRKFSSDNSIARNLTEEAKIIASIENVGFT